MKERIREMKAATTAIDMTIFDLILFSSSNYSGSRCSSLGRSLIKKPPSKEKRKAEIPSLKVNIPLISAGWIGNVSSDP